MKQYTPYEIQELRRACETIYLFGSTRMSTGAMSSRTYHPRDKDAAVESMVLTYIAAGITAADIYKADNETGGRN